MRNTGRQATLRHIKTGSKKCCRSRFFLLIFSGLLFFVLIVQECRIKVNAIKAMLYVCFVLCRIFRQQELHY